MPEIIQPTIVEPNIEVFSAAEKRGYLAALERAIATGVDYVSMDGNQTKFQSLSNMLRIRDLLRKELGIGKAKRSRVTRARMERS
jgi:hypothetical protein